MKRFIVSILFLTSCAASTAPDKANFVSAQSQPNENATVEKRQDASKPLLPVKRPEKTPFMVPETDFTWQDIYFEGIIEQEKVFKLQRLKSKAFRADDFEVRKWSGFGLTHLQGFVFRRISGDWSAIDLRWISTAHRNDKLNAIPSERKLGAPKSGWEAAWQRLVDAGILILPDAQLIDCKGGALDGESYVVEYKLKDGYRTYMYDNPQYAKCSEAKRMIEINEIIAEEFY